MGVASGWAAGGRRAFVTAAAAAVGGLVLPRRAWALRGWCKTDPVVLIGGKLADILVAVDNPVEMVFESTGPVEYEVTLPRGVRGVAVRTVGFGRGERFRFKSSRRLKQSADGIELRIAVRVPAAGDYPLALEFAPEGVGLLNPDRIEGRTNERVVLNTVL